MNRPQEGASARPRALPRVLALGILGGFLLLSIGLALAVGPGGPAWRLPGPILTLRLLRLALGVFAGGALALTGAALQGMLRNPLADPFTLGVSSGAAFGVTLASFLGLASGVLSPLFGIAGAGLTALVLAGVIISFLLSSGVMLLVVLGRRTLGEAVYVLMGHLGFTFTGGSLWIFVPGAVLALAGCAALVAFGRDLDILSTGEETASGLGVDVNRVTALVFASTALIVGVVVAFTGAVSFVGLVVPHLARFLVGPRHRRVMPVAFAIGAGMLL
ncbi:MAG TPA: iron ABC transporter permease, partial [candidate division WOR-3 bacterium]|nr:iron ABC transporter permease [candidate division WOR-3 bacterium]